MRTSMWPAPRRSCGGTSSAGKRSSNTATSLLRATTSYLNEGELCSMMRRVDWHQEGEREDERTENSVQADAAARSLENQGVDLTGSESGTELAMMKSAVDEFRQATEMLAGRIPLTGHGEDLCRQV